MRVAGSRIAKTGLCVVPAALIAIFLASCSSTTSDINTAGFAGGMTASDVEAGGVGDGTPLSASVEADGEAALKREAAGAEAGADATPGPIAEGDSQPAIDGAAKQAAEAPAGEQPKQFLSATPAPDNGTYLTAGQMPADAPIAAKKKTFLSSLFGATPAAAATAAQPAPAKVAPEPPQAKAKPVIELPKTDEDDPAAELSLASLSPKTEAMDSLPGVRTTALFEIKRKSGIDDESDIDLHEDEEMPLQLASAGGYARTGPNGLLVQRPDVDVSCLKPNLVRMLKQIERYYGKKMVVTSGYRSPQHNKRVRGAKKSMHMYCAAVDVQIAGVSKWELANYARALPGRGGVGTYCHTNSVHIDVGPERDWNWKCKRRKA